MAIADVEYKQIYGMVYGILSATFLWFKWEL